MQPLVSGTMYLPDATALRMGRLGYQNSAQRQLGIHYNNMQDYIQGIEKAIRTPYQPFSELGLDDAQGEPLQINDHVLQIENEYYSPIRPKQIPKSGETPAQALKQRGVAYIELRAVDINPYSDIGIDLETACFLEIVALYALLQDSPAIDEDEQSRIDRNLASVVDRGRQAGLSLETSTGEQLFDPWAAHHLQQMQTLAQLLDQADGAQLYQNALALMQTRLADTSLTLSAQVLKDTVEAGGSWRFGHALASRYANQQREQTLSPEQQDYFGQVAQQSWQAQQQLEQQPANFSSYLAPYRYPDAVLAPDSEEHA